MSNTPTLQTLKSFVRNSLSRIGWDVTKNSIKTPLWELNRSSAKLYGPSLYQSIFPQESIAKKSFYNIGAGNWRHPYWTNIDYYSEYYDYKDELLDIHWDISSLCPVKIQSGSAELVYCSHTVEHLTESQDDFLFKEMHRILKPGGIARITCPNIELYYQAYKRRDVWFNFKYGYRVPFGSKTFKGYHSENMSIWLVNEMATQLVTRPDNQRARYTNPAELDALFESNSMDSAMEKLSSQIDYKLQAMQPGQHVSWWTPDKLRDALKKAGFNDVIISVPGGSVAPVMRDRKYFDTVYPANSLFVEAIK